MNKKTLFLILFAVNLIPLSIAHAGTELCRFVGNVETLAINIGGSVVVIGWIIAGILYLTSGGSPEKTVLAKKAMIAAIIGTILIILSYSAFKIINDALQTGATLWKCNP